MKMAVIFGSLFAVVLLLVSVGLFLHSESPHDRDLRECRERYGGSRYAEPRDAAYSTGLVAACMRGRGY
jgi:hypothetical protein